MLEEATGVSGELNVVVDAPDVTDPAVIDWMADFKQRVLAAHGFSGEFPSCRGRRPLPRISLPDPLRQRRGCPPGQVRTLLESLPPYFLRR